jgi:hypothetical protein
MTIATDIQLWRARDEPWRANAASEDERVTAMRGGLEETTPCP